MVEPRRLAGQNIRRLAAKRRFKAMGSFISAGLIIVAPVILFKILENFLKQTFLLTSKVQFSLFQFSAFIFPILFILVALGLAFNGVYLWQQADRADRGAKGEEDVAKEMEPLERESWQIEYGMLLAGRLGDADILCISPQSRAYVVDVKSHRGEVIMDGNQLSRRMGKATYKFEKDFLECSMKQALQVKKQKGLNFVTPIVVFSDAKVSVTAGKHRGVHVVEKLRLVSLLRSLG
ncbi:nuclease-related domain-containing protein [Tumidithrix elongata RA019]|uniref:Nuclease-related domain-containing protein n=1 Tax=Tumidithrix elongata BACA0141 TaxID=2716417 RepID=A0AAW9Q8Q4_9CYAN|nr:nuclease-related domain-containing protein [Tumidithrix elongata RA019]